MCYIVILRIDSGFRECNGHIRESNDTASIDRGIEDRTIRFRPVFRRVRSFYSDADTRGPLD